MTADTLSAEEREAAPEVIALADAWASIDGKLMEFRAGGEHGHREGYIEEAMSMIERLMWRGFRVVPAAKLATPELIALGEAATKCIAAQDDPAKTHEEYDELCDVMHRSARAYAASVAEVKHE